MCMKSRVWSSSDPVALEVKEHMQQVLLLLGDVLESHRSGDVNEDANKLTYLQLLALTRKLLVAIVPVSIADSILHRKLKSALSRSLLDLSVITLFPTLHADILQYVKEFHMDLSVKYESTMAICASMKAAVRFLKNYDKLERELVSLDESNRKVVTGVILKLLAHSEPHVKLEMYGCCHKYVVAILGVQQVPRTSADSLRQLDFLFDTAVLIEIISHGAASLEKKIQLYSEEMLIHLLKGKFLLPEPIWRRFLECLIPALPLLQCYADQTTSLGRAIVKIFDPGTGHSIHLPSSEVRKTWLDIME
ncbi:hypothetical protein B7P43_G14779 [Cryptotermes secundus]|uniref:Uncharacterized protein n=1 Tax=Cryptotermes secundus TaxID=105785 RepID=A0A2J7RM75_9NEOP|nr:hypothetical protein B7P43_G14779 [Cryptotermes secundus]